MFQNKVNYIICLILFNIVYPCAVCYVNPDDPTIQGMNNGIFFMLMLICFLLMIIGYFMYNLYKKEKLTMKGNN